MSSLKRHITRPLKEYGALGPKQRKRRLHGHGTTRVEYTSDSEFLFSDNSSSISTGLTESICKEGEGSIDISRTLHGQTRIGESNQEDGENIGNECTLDVPISTEDDLSDNEENDESHSSFREHTGDNSYLDFSIETDEVNIADSALKSELAHVAIVNNIPHTTMTQLLQVMKNHPSLSFLPSDSRTLLKTPRVVNTISMSPGQYYHFGVGIGASRAIAIIGLCKVPDQINIQINIDGAPLSKSSSSQFWPILGMIRNVTNDIVFPIGIYQGSRKPEDSNKLLEKFFYEANEMEIRGLVVQNRKLEVRFSFVFDAPAMSYILKTRGHSGKFGCSKCETKGVWVRTPGSRYGRQTFPETRANLRSDHSFRRRRQEQHHLGHSLLENLRYTKMVEDFPVDPMHLLDLGVMRKLLLIWTTGKHFSHRKLSIELQTQLEKRINLLRPYIPSDFARKPRENALREIGRWKATELNQFLCYTGPVVLKGLLSEDVYNHFLYLHAGARLMCHPKLCKDQDVIDYCSVLFRKFVKCSIKLYGPHFVSYNVHNLIHLPEDVRRFGPTDTYAAYPFENYNKKILGMVRKSARPLSPNDLVKER